jgi:hypothetical protein
MAHIKNKYVTKKEVEKYFKNVYYWNLNPKKYGSEPNCLPCKIDFKKDKPAKRQIWNDLVDSLKKDGTINPNSNWNQPNFISK